MSTALARLLRFKPFSSTLRQRVARTYVANRGAEGTVLAEEVRSALPDGEACLSPISAQPCDGASSATEQLRGLVRSWRSVGAGRSWSAATSHPTFASTSPS